MAKKCRVDELVVAQGLAPDLETARRLIMAGEIRSGDRVWEKAGERLPADSILDHKPRHCRWVSRGGLKLERAVAAFSMSVAGFRCLDIGASTGGFTDVLLKRGAAHVYAIDVGYGQLDWSLRNHPNVTVMERTNARYLQAEQFSPKPGITVMDVSFISIRLILPVAAAIMGENGRFYTLIKPQFEAGRERVGKKGVVRDPAVHRDVLGEIASFVPSFGFRVAGLTYSPIKGPEGNIEFLACIVPEGSDMPALAADAVEKVVEEAHLMLQK